jgi:hypothetical protein
MNFLNLILADGSDPVWKVGFGIIVFILWGVGAMASAVRKQKQQERLRQKQMWQEVEQEMKSRRDVAMAGRQGSGAPRPHPMVAPPPVPPPVPPQWLPPGARGMFDRRVPPPPPVRAIPVQRIPQPVAARPPKTTKRRRTPPAANVPPVPRAQGVQRAAPPVPRGQAVASPTPPVRTATPSANAVALNRWLSAGTLRSQFILTEILQPPLALREPREL